MENKVAWLMVTVRSILDRLSDLEFRVRGIINGTVVLPNTLLAGIGDPNGVVSAPVPAYYMDLTNPAAPIIYLHTSDPGGNTGWI